MLAVHVSGNTSAEAFAIHNFTKPTTYYDILWG